jgi:hypothetical protein
LPITTLRDRVLGKIDAECISSGRPPLLSLDDEAKIVNHLKIVATYGYGYTRSEVANVASDYTGLCYCKYIYIYIFNFQYSNHSPLYTAVSCM